MKFPLDLVAVVLLVRAKCHLRARKGILLIHLRDTLSSYVMQLSSDDSRICIDIYDDAGIGGGASGASGGLLHPYSPKGARSSLGFMLNMSKT